METNVSIDNEIKDYFDTYIQLFLQDLVKFNECYSVPSISVRDDGTFYAFMTKEQAYQFFEDALKRYSEEGCKYWLIKNLSVTPLGALAVMVTIDWVMERDDHSPIRGWRQSYNLFKSSDGWKITLSTVHGGTQQNY